MDYLDALEVIEKIKTSTGSEDIFDYYSVAKRLIELTIIRRRVEEAEKVLRRSLNIEGMEDKLPYEDDNGKVIQDTRGIYEQDIAALQKALPKEVFLRACTISKSKTSDDKEEKRHYTAIIEQNTDKVGERTNLRVILKQEKVKEIVGSIEVQ